METKRNSFRFPVLTSLVFLFMFPIGAAMQLPLWLGDGSILGRTFVAIMGLVCFIAGPSYFLFDAIIEFFRAPTEIAATVTGFDRDVGDDSDAPTDYFIDVSVPHRASCQTLSLKVREGIYDWLTLGDQVVLRLRSEKTLQRLMDERIESWYSAALLTISRKRQQS